jgi:hypothetical protein
MWHEMGEPDRAQALALRLIDQVSPGWMHEAVAYANVVLALVAMDRTDISTAVRRLDEAARVLGDLPYLPVRVEFHLARARLLADQHKLDEAWAALTAAEAALGQIAGQIHDPDLKDSFLSSWLAKRVGAARMVLAEAHSRR